MPRTDPLPASAAQALLDLERLQARLQDAERAASHERARCLQLEQKLQQLAALGQVPEQQQPLRQRLAEHRRTTQLEVDAGELASELDVTHALAASMGLEVEALRAEVQSLRAELLLGRQRQMQQQWCQVAEAAEQLADGSTVSKQQAGGEGLVQGEPSVADDGAAQLAALMVRCVEAERRLEEGKVEQGLREAEAERQGTTLLCEAQGRAKAAAAVEEGLRRDLSAAGEELRQVNAELGELKGSLAIAEQQASALRAGNAARNPATIEPEAASVEMFGPLDAEPESHDQLAESLLLDLQEQCDMLQMDRDQLRVLNNALVVERDQLRGQVEGMQAELHHASLKLEEERAERQRAALELGKVQAELGKAQAELQHAASELDKQTSACLQAMSELDKGRAERLGASQELERAQAEHLRLTLELDKEQAERRRFSLELDKELAERQRAEARLNKERAERHLSEADLMLRIGRLEGDQDTVVSELHRLEGNRDATASELPRLQLELCRAEAARDSAAEFVGQLQAALAQAEESVAVLAGRLDRMEALRCRDQQQRAEAEAVPLLVHRSAETQTEALELPRCAAQDVGCQAGLSLRHAIASSGVVKDSGGPDQKEKQQLQQFETQRLTALRRQVSELQAAIEAETDRMRGALARTATALASAEAAETQLLGLEARIRAARLAGGREVAEARAGVAALAAELAAATEGFEAAKATMGAEIQELHDVRVSRRWGPRSRSCMM